MLSAGGAAYPAVSYQNKFHFLKLNIRAVYTTTMVEFVFGL